MALLRRQPAVRPLPATTQQEKTSLQISISGMNSTNRLLIHCTDCPIIMRVDSLAINPLVETAMRYFLSVLSFLLGAAGAQAELVKLTILQRKPFAEGKAFGETGPYEVIIGVAHFAIDPANAHNKIIVDLDKAP